MLHSPGFGVIRRASYDVTATKAEYYDVPLTSVSDSDTISDTSNKVLAVTTTVLHAVLVMELHFLDVLYDAKIW